MRPGPPGVRPRTVLAAYFRRPAHDRPGMTPPPLPSPARALTWLDTRALTWLDNGPEPPAIAGECIAASCRLYRGFDFGAQCGTSCTLLLRGSHGDNAAETGHEPRGVGVVLGQPGVRRMAGETRRAYRPCGGLNVPM